jgi:hypothetical protein
MFFNEDEGVCRRFPPSVGEFSEFYPKTRKVDFCGEHKRYPTKKKEKEPSSNVQDVIAFYCEEFMATFDVNPSITGKDSGAAINMLKDHTKADVCRTISKFFKDTPEWEEERNMYGLNNIASAWNKMAVRRKITTNSTDDITYEAMLNEQAVKYGGHPTWDEYHGMILDTHELMTFEEFLSEYGTD